MGYGSNNLVITKYLVKVSLVKKSGVIYIKKRQKLLRRVNPPQTASLNFVENHNLKSNFNQALRLRNSLLRIGLNTQEFSNSGDYPTNDYPTFNANSTTMQFPS